MKEKEPPTELVSIVSSILEADKKEENNEGSSKLAEILADALKHDDTEKKAASSDDNAPNLIKIAGEIVKPKPELSDDAKLDVIRTLTSTLAENRVEPKFSLPWLLTYLHEIQKSNADEPTKAAFNKWAWDAFNESRPAAHGHANAAQEKLGNVPPAVMTQFANDIAKQKHSDADVQKVANFLLFLFISDINFEKLWCAS